MYTTVISVLENTVAAHHLIAGQEDVPPGRMDLGEGGADGREKHSYCLVDQSHVRKIGRVGKVGPQAAGLASKKAMMRCYGVEEINDIKNSSVLEHEDYLICGRTLR